MSKKNPKHLALVRTYPCVARHMSLLMVERCMGATEAHHPTGGGMALKTDDSKAFPLCSRHHADFHALRGVFKGWEKARIKEWQAQMSERFKPVDEVF